MCLRKPSLSTADQTGGCQPSSCAERTQVSLMFSLPRPGDSGEVVAAGGIVLSQRHKGGAAKAIFRPYKSKTGKYSPLKQKMRQMNKD